MTLVLNVIAFNGTTLLMQPDTHRWIPRENLGFTGDGHQILPAVREYEMTFTFDSAEEFNQVIGFLNTLGNATGTITAYLPEYGASTYGFKNYSGCILQEPEYSSYFENYYQDVKIRLSNIRT